MARFAVGGRRKRLAITVATAAAMLACAPGASGQLPEVPRLPDTPVTAPVQQVADQAESTANQIVNQTPVGSPPSGGNNPPSGGENPSGGGTPSSNGGGSSGPSTRGSNGSGGGSSGSSGNRGSAADRRAARRRAARRREARRAAAARRDSRQRPAKDNGGGKKDDTPGVLRPVRDVVEVIPVPMWIALGVFALLAAGFYVRSMLTTRRARGLEEQRTELMGDIGLLQKALLPEVPAQIGGLDASVAYRPAEGPAAGGDFYDVFEMEGHRVGIIVGDVCGHGRQALAVTALMRYSLRAYLNAGGEPRSALQIAARALENEQHADLTTVVLAVYDAAQGTLTYACAGHEPPILIGPGAHEPVTVGSAPPIGAGMTTGLRQTTVALPPGASACFFTDGLVEARMHGDDLLGRDRLTKIVEELGPGADAAALLERIATTAERAPDDMAACIIRAGETAVPSPNVRVEDLELDALDTGDTRARGFLKACGVSADEADSVLKTAAGAIAEFGGALLRVKLDANGGGLKVVPLEVRSLAASANGNEPSTTVPAAPPLSA
jgi:stage II sporulation SpoE-like protein